MAFRVGERVVCVDDSARTPGGRWHEDEKIERGCIYTIASLWVDPWGFPVVDFVECKRSTEVAMSYGVERLGYCRTRFRPLIERKTSTGFEILDDIRKRETTRAPVRATV